jgi:hypothetical protein
LLALAGCYEALDWREWHAEDGSFMVMMPAKPKSFRRELAIGEHKLLLNMLSTDSDGLAFGMAYADVPAGASLSLVKDARDALVQNIGGQIVSEKLVEAGEAKGLQFQATGRSGEIPMFMAARVLRDEKRFYQIVFVGREDSAAQVDSSFFLESFKPAH